MPEKAAQSPHAGAPTPPPSEVPSGVGAPSETPPRPKIYDDDEVNSIVARKTEAAEKRGREKALTDLMASLGVQSEDDLRRFAEVGRKAAPAQESAADRAIAEMRAAHAKEIAAGAAERASLQAERDAAVVMAEARRHLEDVHDPELFLERYRLRGYRFEVRAGAAVAVDRNDVDQPLGKFLVTEKARDENRWLLRAIGAGSGARAQSPAAPPQLPGNGKIDHPRTFRDALRRKVAEGSKE